MCDTRRLYRFSKCSCSCLESLEKSGGHTFFKREGLDIDDALDAVAVFVVVAFPAACAIRRASVGNMVACGRRILWSRPVGGAPLMMPSRLPTSNPAPRGNRRCAELWLVFFPLWLILCRCDRVLIAVHPTMQDPTGLEPRVPLHQTGGTVGVSSVCAESAPQNLRRAL